MKKKFLDNLSKSQMRNIIGKLDPDAWNRYKKMPTNKCYKFVEKFSYKEIIEAFNTI